MRGSDSNHGNSESERVVRDNNLPQVVEEPCLPGAYICNLVEQLTSLGVKDSMNRKEHLYSSLVHDRPQESSTHIQTLGKSQREQPRQPSRRKKQARRRLYTTRPNQEDLLDMAEARREIVTALRLHRASMQQNNNHHPPPSHQTLSETSFQATPQPQNKVKAKLRRNSKTYDSTTTLNFSNNLENLTYQSFPYQPPQTSYSWPMYASAPPPIPENFNLVLPNQTLGLNLNLQDFNDLDASPSQINYIPAGCYSCTSLSTSNIPPLSVAREETPSVGLSQAPLVEDLGIERDLGLHHAVDDEEMAEIRLMAEQHQIEWDDAMNMVNSAWWFYILNTMENGTNSNRFGMEFPPWLNTNDNCFQQLDEFSKSDIATDGHCRD